MVEKALKAIEGVTCTVVDMKYAKVVGDVLPSKLIESVAAVGYTAEEEILINIPSQSAEKEVICQIVRYQVSGMTCASCVSTIENYVLNKYTNCFLNSFLEVFKGLKISQ
jgi:copper chaperone CopZ